MRPDPRTIHQFGPNAFIQLAGEPNGSDQPTELQVAHRLGKVTLTRIVGKNHTQFHLSAAEAQSVADALQRLMAHVHEHEGNDTP